MDQLIKYHHNTIDLALFESDGEYWVGSYNPHLTHCNVDCPYPFSYLKGYFETEAEGLEVLNSLRGNEF